MSNHSRVPSPGTLGRVGEPQAFTSITIRRATPPVAARHWHQYLGALVEHDLRLLKQEGPTRVVIAASPAPGGAPSTVLKILRHDGLIEQARAVLGMTRLHRQWRGDARLARADLQPPVCQALARAHTRAGEVCTLLVLEHLGGPDLLGRLHECRRIGAGAEKTLNQLAAAAARLASRVAAAGLFNRDQKPSNIVVHAPQGGASDEPRLVVIDTVGVRSARSAAARRTAHERMLFSLVIEPLGTGLLPRRAVLMRALVRACPAVPRAERKALWRAVAARVHDHGDPAPRVNPLTPPATPTPPAR